MSFGIMLCDHYTSFRELAMKLIKKAGKTTVKMSRRAWAEMGRKAGWLSKSAAEKVLKQRSDFSLFNPDTRVIKNTGKPAQDDPVHYEPPKDKGSDVGWGGGGGEYYYPYCGQGGNDHWYTKDRSEVTCPQCLAKLEGKPIMESITCPQCNGEGKIMVEKR